MKGYRKKFGITRIALVVTIIVMLILAGVGINLIIGNNGLINRAEKAIFQHLTGEEIDILNMSHATLYINNKTFKEEYTTEKLQDEIIRMGKDVTVKRKKDDDNTMVITYKKTQNVYFIDIDKGEIIYRGHYIGEPVADFKENDIIFTQDNTEITNKNVNTTIQVRESINMTNYTLQWTKTPTVENSWQVYSLGQLITSEKNEVIFARIKNNVTEETELESSTTIKNIDKKKPVVEEIVSTTNKITFKATDTKDETNPYDKPSGIVGYKVSTDADSKDGFLFCDTTFELLETLKGYNQGTRYYVWVVDEACNISEIKSTLTGTVTQLNTANRQFISEPDGDTPTNDKVITKIHTTITEYKLQWTKTPLIDESWTDYDENYPIQSNQNEVIYARVIDSTGQSAQIVDETTGQASAVYTSTQIKNIDKLEPEIKNVESIKTTTNSIKVKVTANDQSETSINSCSGIKGYYYSNDDGQKYSEITTEPTYTFEDLTQGTNYKIKVKVEDNAGNINVFSTNLETNTVAGLTKANTQFAYNLSDWTNGNVTVTLPTKSPYTTVYSTTGVPDANSTKYTGPFSVGSNCTIYYAYSDGSNVGKYGSLTVDNIDKNAPNAQITPASANKFVTQSVNIAVSIDDGLSGVDTGNCKWVFNTTSSEIGTNQNSYSGGTFSSNNQTITVSASSAGTYYLHVLTKDGVGNLKETISSGITFKNVTLSLSSTSGTVAVNGTKSATINGSNYGSLSASSSNSSVTTASISGTTLTITARSSGTATITVRESNLGRTASYSITGHAHSTACYRHVHSSYCYSTHYHSGSSSSGGGCYGNAVYKTVTETTYDNCSVRWVACSGSFNPQGKISVSSALCYQHYTPIYVNVTSNTMKCAYCGASYTISSYSCGHGYSATGSHNLVPGGYDCPGHTTTSQVIDYYTTSCGMSNGQSYLSCGRSTDYTYICGY